MELKIEYVDIDSIKPYKNNAKLHPQEQIEQIKKSIEQFGMDDPIGVWKDEIVEGHGRLIACKELGMETVPIIRLDHLTDEQRKAYTLAHNKLTMNSDFDIDLLNQELASIENIDMEDFGFNPGEDINREIEIIEDEVPDTPDEPKSKLGEIYQLGKHRLMCGDSTSPEDVNKLIGNTEIDLIVTDPPYNVDLGEVNKTKVKMAPERYKGANVDSIENDKMEDQEFVDFLTKAFGIADEHLKPGGAFYIWHSSTENFSFQEAMHNVGWKLRQILIWNKSSLCLGLSDYQWKHEPCLYGWKEGAGHYFIDDRKQTTVLDQEEIDFDKLTKEKAIKLLKETYEGIKHTTVLDYHKPLKNGLHPTMKPVELIARLITNSSKKNENVLDLFGGSGSTLMACEQLDRPCYMMEYDPKYVDVIIERWEAFTGDKAVKISEGD
jgi:DNA modification methylase